MSIKRLVIGAVALVALVSIAGGAGAEPYTTGFEAPTFSTTFNGGNPAWPAGTVGTRSPGPNQDGWHSAVPGDVPALPNGYDQAIVDNSGFGQDGGAPFGDQSLRISNAYTNGEFFYQTYSKSTTEPAGESVDNNEYIGEFQFISTSAAEQPGLFISVSPDNGVGARMSYVSLEDTATGIQMTFYDTDASGAFVAHDLGIYPRNVVHTIKFWIKFVPGEANDIVRLFVDGIDQGDRLDACFTTWEEYYRDIEQNPVPVTNSLEFRSSGTAAPALLGQGYLFDNVVNTTADGTGPAPGTCGETEPGAFCSPGYWKNASDAAWALTGIAPTDLFNDVVVPDFYVNDITPDDTTLWEVLTVKGAKGANKYGGAADPFGLNPFIAVAAALTDAIPGYVFDPAAYLLSQAGIDTCPLDNHGNVIERA